MGTGMQLSAGTVVGRDFRVVRPLAEGGMGAVYVVEQLSTGKQRALKVMHPRFAADPRSRERFELEARAGGRVPSDHVVEVVAAGVDEATLAPWMVMELLDGETLDATLARRGALPWEEAHEVFAQLGHALAAAHAVGIVHRDLKPENIVLARPRRAGVPFTLKVLDFGIAKLLTEGVGANTQAIGSPHWMAPEQTVSGTAIGTPTDVWALGLIAYTVLTGAEYWRNAHVDTTNPMALFLEVGGAPIAPASERAAERGHAHLLPAGFDGWFARGVVREMSARFPDAAEATAALLPLLQAPPPARSPLAFASTEAVPVYAPPAPTAPRTLEMPASVGTAPWGTPEPPAHRPAPAPRRRRGLLWAGLGGGALLVAGGGAVFVLDPFADPTVPRAPGGVAPVTTTPVASTGTPDGDNPFVAQQRWAGSYACGGERTPLVLTIVSVTGDRVAALFEFTNAAGVTGSYRMSGAYVDATRRLSLSPGEWVQQPPGYVAVGLDGTVATTDDRYDGRMVHASCEDFTVRLVDE